MQETAISEGNFMKKNRFYLLFILLITILVFSTVFILSGCCVRVVDSIDLGEKIRGAFNSIYDVETEEDGAASEFDVEEPEELESDSGIIYSENEDKEGNGNEQEEKYYYSEPLKINFMISYDIKLIGKTEKIEFTTLIPDDYKYRQNVYETVYSMTPDETFVVGSNKYAKFIIKPEDDLSFSILSEMEICDYDLAIASENYNDLEEDNSIGADNISEYIKEEDFIEKDNHQIQEISKSFTQENKIDQLKEIYDFVLDHLTYTDYIPEDVGAVDTLNSKGGDCSCYSDFLITLCRACDIPARAVGGYTIEARDLNTGHDWVEVYLDNYGWVPFDPTFDDNNGDSIYSTFENLKNVYVYMSFIRNDSTLKNYHFYAYTYWGDNVEIVKNIEILDVN